MCFEDRIDTITDVRQDLIEQGYDPQISTKSKGFSEVLRDGPPDHCGWLIDNHIPKLETLKDFGKPKIDTERGSLAGFKIIAEILVPRMKSGELPRRPIGLMSGRDLGRARDLFNHRFGDSEFKDNVFFFRKTDALIEGGDRFRYMEALRCQEEAIPQPPRTREQIALMMVESFQETFAVSDPDLDRIFRTRGDTSIARQVALGQVDMSSDSWEEMAALLFKVRIALRQVFSGEKDVDAAAQRWLRREKLQPDGKAPLALLLTGEFLSAYRVLDAVTFSVELS